MSYRSDRGIECGGQAPRIQYLILKSWLPAVTLLGPELASGAYLLRIRLAAGLQVAFGRFCGGRPIELPAGDYAYLGSAMGVRGGATLARRVLRHSLRSGGRPPHAIRDALQRALSAEGAEDARPAAGKRLHWHIDYLLDRPETSLSHAILLRSDRHLERAISGMLAGDPHVRVPAPGLGASDAPGSTHLLRVEAGEGWWVRLPQKMQTLAQGEAIQLKKGR